MFFWIKSHVGVPNEAADLLAKEAVNEGETYDLSFLGKDVFNN